MEKNAQKPLCEFLYAEQLNALKKNDTYPKPQGWQLSPMMVKNFIIGLDKPLDNVVIDRKFFGDDALVERSIITLASNRGLMLVGDPGTAKTMLSELLSAAISNNSATTVQGSIGTSEDNVKYSWNYALLLAEGPSLKSLVPSPIYKGMTTGTLVRFEEITRCPQEIQDTLISIMSDKVLMINELGEEGVILAKPGFNIIATANTRDKGVNEMSSALKRRFNFETVKPISNIELEKQIVTMQVNSMLKSLNISTPIDNQKASLLSKIFVELRTASTEEGYKVDKFDSVLSTADNVSTYLNCALTAHYFNNGLILNETIVNEMATAVAKDNPDDSMRFRDYFEKVVKFRADKIGGIWKEIYLLKRLIK